jgi:hypothetical protein
MLLAPIVLIAQAATAPPLISGSVTNAESGQPLGFSIVTLQPGGRRQFTDRSGTFAFTGAPAGRYVLSVRQIGYTPLDTQLAIDGERPAVLQIALRHLAIELPPVTVTANRCTNPGPPDSTDKALRAVFDQLQENARRFELLADSYPFHFTLSLSIREVGLRGDTGPPELQRIQLPSNDHHPYHVGRVVERAWGPWGDPDHFVVIRSAELRDLGNAEFIANHCFHLMGRDTIEGHALVRLDFEPALRIGSADMAGTAYLDPESYELRYTVTVLTRPERSELSDVSGMTFRTRFRDIARGVPLQDSLTAITTYRFSRERRAKIDTQRTVEVRFKREPPPP